MEQNCAPRDAGSAARERLDLLVRGLAGDIMVADQAYWLYRSIGQHSAQLNQANLGTLFGFLQIALNDVFTLALTRIFENSPSSKTRSIRAVLLTLERDADSLEVEDRLRLIDYLTDLETPGLKDLPDNQLTHEVAQYFRDRLPSIDREDCELSKALEAHKANRDKRIAHFDLVERATIPTTTWERSRELLDFAKRLVSALGWGYLSTGYEWGGDYLLGRDAERIGIAFERLMVMAGLAEEDSEGG